MNKRIGRAPPQWVYDFLDLKFKGEYVSRDEIAARLNISVDTLRKKISRLSKQPTVYDIKLNSGQTGGAYDIDEIREIFLQHIKDWDDPDYLIPKRFQKF